MREIKIVQWCDMCEGNDDEQLSLERSPATQAFTVGVIDSETQRPELHLIDVCDTHAKQFVELAAMLQRLPNPTSKNAPKLPALSAKAAPVRKVPCPVCQAQIDKVSLVSHIWSNHRSDKRPPSVVGKCPDCPEMFEAASGMALHRRYTHQHSALIEVLSGVKGYKVTGREDDL
jgi:hypothetical protein